MADTVIGNLEARVRAHADRPALRSKRDGAWQTTSWREYGAAVRQAGRGFVALGAPPRGGVAIVGFNRPEWFVANLGAIAAGALPAGIYTTSAPEQCRYVAEHSEAAVLVLENASYLATFLGFRAALPHLRAIVLMEGTSSEPGVLSWPQFLERALSVPDSEIDQRLAVQRPQDPCTLIYTSGTTGPPKAVMLSHRNVTFISGCVVELLALGPEDRVLSYLPLSHIAEQLVSLHVPIGSGACTYFAESLERLRDNLLEARPTLFFGVPRVWEKLQAAIQAAGAQAPPLRRRIVAWARRVGLEGGRAGQRGGARPWSYPLADALIFSKVRQRLGLDAARFCVTSAAPIAVETIEFFLGLGIPLLELYGMSECTGPTTASLPGSFRVGKAGRIVPGTEVRVADDGEILIRGPHVFLGYYKDPAATAEILDGDGWLHSGDVGEVDVDGFVRVTDRKKELLITSGGKNVAPQPIEAQLRQISGVAHAVLVGDRRPYVAALLTLAADRLPLALRAAGSPAGSAAEAATCPIFRAWMEQQVAAVNAGLARYESVRRIALLPGELTVEAGLLTPTLKLKRKPIAQAFAAEIEGLYSG